MHTSRFICAAHTPSARSVERTVKCERADADDLTREDAIAILENMVREGKAPRADIERARKLARPKKG